MADTEANDTKCPESWGEHNGSYYQVTGGLVKSKSDNEWGCCVYGSTFVKEGIHEWVIKYEHTEDSQDGWIGIVTHSGQHDPWRETSFGFYHHAKRQIDSSNPSWKVEKELAMEFKDGDTIRILLNYEKK
eukprot:297592_1